MKTIHPIVRMILIVPVLVTSIASTLVADWPQWRGPNRDGVVSNAMLPKTLPTELKSMWSIPVGEGHSSPILADKQIFIHTGDGKRETIQCIDSETGKEVWSHAYDVSTEKVASVVGRFGYSPRATPSIAGNYVVTMGASGVVCCLNRETGAVHWQHDFKDEFEVPYPEFGAAASPLVIEFQVIVPVGGPAGGKLVALEIGSGKPAWSLQDDGPSYSSPMLIRYGKDSSMIVTQTQRTFTGVSLEGKRLWELPFETPYLQNIITTTPTSNSIITGGTKRPLQEFIVDGTAIPKPSWENADHSIYMNSPVIFDGMVIGVSERDKGHLFAVDASTGKTLWKTMQRMGENVEVLVCDGYLVLMADSGKLTFAKVTRTGAEVVQTYTVSEEPVTTHPVLNQGWIYVKDRANLIAFRWE